MHLSEYLRHTAGTRDIKLKFNHQDVRGGYVLLTEPQYRAVIATKPGKEPVRKKHAKMPARSKLDIAHVPPCIVALIRAAVKGTNLTQQGRFAIVAFMCDAGVNIDEVSKIFSSQPDFDENYCDYQINHIYGKGYACPGCKKMREARLCMSGEDSLCKDIHNPIQFFKVKSSCK